MKQRTRFTPGPYRVGPVSKHGLEIIRADSSDDEPYVIAVIRGPEDDPDGCVDVYEPDALLLASSPEMFDALVRASMWLGKMIADGGHKNSVMPQDAVNTLNKMEKLIQRIIEVKT